MLKDGNTYVIAWDINAGVSLREEAKWRRWMKSKLLAGYTQGLSASSTMNFTFGGTHEGWMGLKSIPKTDALGYSSPTGCVSIEGDAYG